jgi:hypothetical protein
MTASRFSARPWDTPTHRFWVLLLAAPLGLLTSNPLLTATGLAVVPILIWLLWSPGEPPALLFAAGYQWAQVFTPVLRSDLSSQVLGAPPLPDLQLAAWLGLVAIVVLAAGMRLGLGRVHANRYELPTSVERIELTRLTLAYVVTFVVAFALVEVGVVMPSIRQPALALGAIRWVVVFVVLWLASQENRYAPLAILLVVIETIVGLGGFFGGFKFVLFLAVVGILGRRKGRVRLFRPSLVVTGVLILLLGSYWQAVKVQYRSFLNQGTGGQAVLVSPEERYNYLATRTRGVEVSDLGSGFDSMLDRIGYIDFFAEVIGYVPSVLPHQNGRLWGEAITHILTPRVLFPNKAEVSDTLRTAEFTGDPTLAFVTGTSVSIGYVGESYIDFGTVLMFLPIFAVGCFWGSGYRWLATRKAPPLLRVSTAIVFVMSGATLFEMSNVNLIGGGLTNLIVSTFALKYGARPAWGLLTSGPANQGASGPAPAGTNTC